MKLNFLLYWSKLSIGRIYLEPLPRGTRFMSHFGSKIGPIELLPHSPPPPSLLLLLWAHPLQKEQNVPLGSSNFSTHLRDSFPSFSPKLPSSSLVMLRNHFPLLIILSNTLFLLLRLSSVPQCLSSFWNYSSFRSVRVFSVQCLPANKQAFEGGSESPDGQAATTDRPVKLFQFVDPFQETAASQPSTSKEQWGANFKLWVKTFPVQILCLLLLPLVLLGLLQVILL